MPHNHRLVGKESVKFSDLAGEKFLLYQHIGFWKSVCEEFMAETTFLIQPDRETFADLVMNTDYPAFSSDVILKASGTPNGRIAIPIDEEKARYTFYIACRNEDKRKYAAFFNSVRSEIINR